MDEHGGGSGSSSRNENELQALASQFVDLWQRQLEVMSADPALSEMMAAFAKFGTQATGAGGGADENGTANDSSGDATPTGTATRAAPTDAASRQRGSELDELSRRVAACEKRLAQLEQATGAGSGSARKRPGKSRT